MDFDVRCSIFKWFSQFRLNYVSIDYFNDGQPGSLTDNEPIEFENNNLYPVTNFHVITPNQGLNFFYFFLITYVSEFLS